MFRNRASTTAFFIIAAVSAAVAIPACRLGSESPTVQGDEAAQGSQDRRVRAASSSSSTADDTHAGGGNISGNVARAAKSRRRIPRNEHVEHFSAAKKLLRRVYEGHQITLYCGCAYDARGTVNRSSCGYVPRGDTTRTRRIEWEHVVPAHAFGQAFASWRDGHDSCVRGSGDAAKPYKGRECARKVDAPFRFMEADMYNLYPAVGELNEKRGNRRMGMIEGEPRAFGKCDFEVDEQRAEPRPEVRGDIARTYKYMDMAYPGRGIISQSNRKLFDAWDEQDPVDAWECERSRRIAKVQGNINEIVDAACRAANL